MRRALLALVLLGAAAEAGTLVAARTIPSQTVIGPEDVAVGTAAVPGALADPAAAIGREARVILHAGRPIRAADLGPPALVERNGLVTLAYRRGGLAILAEGRALGRAGLGEAVRVMNLASRATVSGVVAGPGLVAVAAAPFPGGRP